MTHAKAAELVMLGARFPVDPDEAVRLIERNARLQRDGGIELVEIATVGEPPAVLHIALGAQPLALTVWTLPDTASGAIELTLHEHFPDFDQYLPG